MTHIPYLKQAPLTLALTLAGTVASADPSCAPHVFSLDLEGKEVTLAADICGLDTAPAPALVQVLLHGGAYDRRYWNPPYDDPRYSYVHAATQRGYVTVNLDRLGYGASTRPDGNTLTFELGAKAVSAVVDQIAAGKLGEARAIVLNGHSMGGIVGEIVAATNPNVSALIVSGLANTPEGFDEGDGDGDAGGPPAGANPFLPATQDARFAGQPWAEGYMTTAPNLRPMIFHAPGTIEAPLAALEEELRDTIAKAELRAVMSGGTDRPAFSGPSVYYLGQFDRIACEGQDCAERFVGTDWHIIVPNAGHSLNLSKAAPVFFEATFDWLATNGLAPAL